MADEQAPVEGVLTLTDSVTGLETKWPYRLTSPEEKERRLKAELDEFLRGRANAEFDCIFAFGKAEMAAFEAEQARQDAHTHWIKRIIDGSESHPSVPLRLECPEVDPRLPVTPPEPVVLSHAQAGQAYGIAEPDPFEIDEELFTLAGTRYRIRPLPDMTPRECYWLLRFREEFDEMYDEDSVLAWLAERNLLRHLEPETDSGEGG